MNPKTITSELGATWAILLVLAAPVALQAQLSYATNGAAITITGYYGGGVLMIPATINGLPVTGIGQSAFQGNHGLSSVKIPASVTSIGEAAFADCASLTGVTIPSSVTSIGDEAFYGCLSLTSVTIPSSVTSIGQEVFFECTGLSSVTIPGSVTSIGMEAFFYCYRLTSVTIPASVTAIEVGAFEDCTNLTSVYCQGDAPSAGSTVLGNDNKTTVYYLPGATGWSSSFAGCPAVMLGGSLQVTLITNGAGIIEHGAWPKSMVIGNKYTVTAAPKPKNVFSGWVGGTAQPYAFLSASASYSFAMQSNLVLTADFVANPFIPVSGLYSGLFYDTNGVELQSSGFFTATTTANGAYSAKIQIAGKVYSFGGKFDVTGATSNAVGGSSPQPLIVILKLDVTGGDALTGQISNGTWTAALTAYRATFNSKTNPAPQAGRYTVCIPGSDNTATSPAGDGYGTVTVNTSGTVTFNGMLGDGTKISQTAMLSKDGQWPFYVSLYAGKGSVLGWLAFLNPALTNGLAAYYPFDGNTGDASGNGNDGTIEGDDSQYALDRFGNPSSLFLNMTDPSNNVLESYVVASRSARFDFNQDFTASVLVNIDPGLPPFHVHNLVSDGPDSTSANLRVISAADGTNDYLQFVGVPLGGGVDIHTFLTPLRNTWEQVVVVRSGTNFSLFQNGTLVTVTNATATMQDGSDIWIGGMPLSINETPSFGEYPLDGGIAQVRMYNRALSPLEVQQLYLTLIGKDVGGFVSWIKSPIPSAKFYPVGFTNETAVIGSKYVFYSQYAFAHGVYPALSFTNGQVWLVGGNLTEGFTNEILFGTNRVMNLGTNISPTNSPKLNLTITGSSGRFSGTVINPLTGKVISINGVLLQNENCGTGYFLGTNQSGRVFFGP